MKKFIAAVLFLSFICTLLAIATTKTQQQKPPKMYIVAMPLINWQVVFTAMQSPDDVTNNQKKEALLIIQQQLNAQIAADTLNKKK